VLCGHGVKLRVNRGALVVEDGFTHYPQERQTHRFFPGDLNLPPRIIVIDGHGTISLDVMTWLSEQGVALVRIDYQGRIGSLMGAAGYAADPAKVAWQIHTRNDPAARLEFCCDLIAEKLRQSLVTLRNVVPDSRARAIAIARAEAGMHTLERRAVGTVDQVREIEAGAAAAYFSSLRGVALNWKRRVSYPVPKDWLTIGSRRSTRNFNVTNRNATHPVNAILNYAYAMLQSEVQIDAIASGFDPRRGILHHDRDELNASPFIFDMMEAKRAKVDAVVIKFLMKEELRATDFILHKTGVCRLVPQLAGRIAETVSLV
jgi:CRISPR-associated endonuclease Cas1